MQEILESLRAFWQDVGVYLPRLVAGLVLLFTGWVVAKLLRRVAIKFFKAVRLDALAEKAGVEDFLLQGGVRYTAVTIMAQRPLLVLDVRRGAGGAQRSGSPDRGRPLQSGSALYPQRGCRSAGVAGYAAGKVRPGGHLHLPQQHWRRGLGLHQRPWPSGPS